MPFANFKLPEGMVTAEQKAEIIHATTNLFARFYGESVRPYTMVLVEEVADGGFGRADAVFDLAFVEQMHTTGE